MFLRHLHNRNALRQCTELLKNYPKCLQTNCEINKHDYHLTSRCTSNLRTPDLIYFPQVMRWVKTKIGFKVLKSTWDPEFSEGAFIYGSTRAICRITEAISTADKHDELKELVTPALRKKLHDEIQMKLSELQRKIIVLTPNDIKLLIPIEVRLSRMDKNQRLCSVALRSLSVKWQELNGGLRLAIIAIQTEFIRDYTEGLKDSQWTVRVFDILECGVVGEVRGAPRE